MMPSPIPSPKPRPQHGFTIIEMMVVVAILSVLMALAAPSFTPLINNWRTLQAAETLQSALYFARSEAIKRGGNVVLQKLPNGTNGCQLASGTNDWGCGWFVCADTNGNGSCANNEPVLQRIDAPSKTEVTRRVGGASIQFNRWGLVSGTWPGFSLMPEGKGISDPAARGVCMSSGGRIRIVTSENVPCNG